MTASPTPALPRLIALAGLAAAAVAAGYALSDRIGLETLAANREMLIGWRDAHYLLTAAGFTLAYAALVALSLPGALIATLTGGFLFGTFPGVVFNVLGATAGASLLFLAVRWGLGARLALRMDRAEGAVGRLKRGIDANQWEMLFLMRLVPVVPFFVANLVPALVGVPAWRFVITTGLGILPGALVYTSVGAGLGVLMAAGTVPDPATLLEPRLMLPLLGLALLAALPMVLRALGVRSPG